jgi:hypothetical protein
MTAAVLTLNTAFANATSIGPSADEVLSEPPGGMLEPNYAIGARESSSFLDYDPGASLDVVELAVSPFLPTGALATGAGFGSLDLAAEGSEPWGTQVSAMVAAIPEPGTLFFLGIGIALLLGRRIVTVGSRPRA